MLGARVSAIVFNGAALFFTWCSIRRAVRDSGGAHSVRGIGALRLSEANLSAIPLVVMKNCAFHSVLSTQPPRSPSLISPVILHSSCSLLRVRHAESFSSWSPVGSLDQQSLTHDQYPRYCDRTRSPESESSLPHLDARFPPHVDLLTSHPISLSILRQPGAPCT